MSGVKDTKLGMKFTLVANAINLPPHYLTLPLLRNQKAFLRIYRIKKKKSSIYIKQKEIYLFFLTILTRSLEKPNQLQVLK